MYVKRFTIISIVLLMSMWAKAGDSLTLYLFLLDDCVICQSYSIKLTQLYNNYGEEVTFLGVFPNFSSKPERIKAFNEKYGIQFPTITDYSKNLTHKFDVKVTPEVVVFNESSQQIIYKGRIDNEFFNLGKRRSVVTTNELEEVLMSIAAGNIHTFENTKAVGCFISQLDPFKTK